MACGWSGFNFTRPNADLPKNNKKLKFNIIIYRSHKLVFMLYILWIQNEW